MGCCARKASAWTTAIMVYTIVQSICSAIWQIYQIMLYEQFVASSVTGNALLDAIQFAYYFHLKGPFGDSYTDESRRVNILAMAHLAVDIFWMFTSIIALSVKSKKKSAYSVNIFWMCTAVIELLIDVTSVALFANDAITWQKSHVVPKEFYAGAILMAIISSRFILPLLVNVCMFFGLASITKALKKPPVHRHQHQQHPHQHHQQQAHLAPRHTQHRIVPLKPAMRAPRPPHLQEQDLSRVNNWYNHYDDPITIPRNPNDDRLREGPNEHHQRRYEMLNPQNLPLRHQHLPQNLPMSPQQFPRRPQTAPQTNAGEPARQDPSNWYNVYDDMQPAHHLPRVKNDGRPHRRHQEEDEQLDLVEYPPRGGGGARADVESYEDAPSELSFNDHQNFVGDHTNVMVNGVPSGTLRRQLPWSYVHQPGMFPRKQTHDLSVEAPPVPVPDYTMRINQNQRLGLDSWSQTSSSPGFNKRNTQIP